MPTKLFLVGFYGKKTLVKHTWLCYDQHWANHQYYPSVLSQAPALRRTCHILLWYFLTYYLVLLLVVWTTLSSNSSPRKRTVESGVFSFGLFSSLHVTWHKHILLTSFSHESLALPKGQRYSQEAKIFPNWQHLRLSRCYHCCSLSLLFCTCAIIVWPRRPLDREFFSALLSPHNQLLKSHDQGK